MSPMMGLDVATFCAVPAVAPDDTLKDADALGFVAALQPAEQPAWHDWARRLRLADRLAEEDPAAFDRLYSAWSTVADHGFVLQEPRVVDAWTRYLDALRDYHRPGLVIRTLAEHDEMLLRLSGPLLQLVPGMPEDLWEAAAAFGALDQFHNNLRDMQEDAERGLCWMPEEVLERHGLTRQDVITGRAPGMRGWSGVMRSLFGGYGRHGHDTHLWLHAGAFVDAKLESASLWEMRRWTMRRYARITRIFRAVGYDYRRFPALYWAEVRRDVATAARTVSQR